MNLRPFSFFFNQFDFQEGKNGTVLISYNTPGELLKAHNDKQWAEQF